MRTMIGFPLATVSVLAIAHSHALAATIKLSHLGSYREQVDLDTPFDPPRASDPQTIRVTGCRKNISEIGGYDFITRRLFVTNYTDDNSVDILDLRHPRSPRLLKRIRLSQLPGLAGANLTPTSVAVRFPLVAVAAEVADTPDDAADPPMTDAGKLLLLGIDGRLLRSYDLAKGVQIPGRPRASHPGSGPDMVTFTPDGRHILVAVEGEPDKSPPGPGKIDPEGSIAVLDLGHGPGTAKLRLADFSAFKAGDLVRQGVRIGTDLTDPEADPFKKRRNSAAKDLEPEFVAVSNDSRWAYASLQENNAVAVVDVDHARVERIVPLGLKDHSLAGAGLDGSRNDGGVNILPQPLHGAYQPDGIAAYRSGGGTFLITANEGDARNGDFDIAQVAQLVAGSDASGNSFTPVPLDPSFPADLTDVARLGELEVSDLAQDLDPHGAHDGLAHQLVSLGGRSFSIWDARGRRLYDSGDQFERITAAATPAWFNTQDDDLVFDRRSPKRGPEPEGAAVGTIRGHTYAFVGLERHSGIMVYDVTNPRAPIFETYASSRDFEVNPTDGLKGSVTIDDVEEEYDATDLLANCTATPGHPDGAGDLGPEGILFIPAALSPNFRPLLVVNYETSGSTGIWQIDPASP
ncbi:MAG: choice-of-anchor I family protein [Geminicoccaceae bacterium]